MIFGRLLTDVSTARSIPVLTLLLQSVVALAGAPAALAGSFPGADIFVIERPANYYRLIEANDRPICSSVLRSLNKAYGMTQERWNWNSNNNLYGELILSSDLQIRWRHTHVISLKGTRPDGSDTFSEDLDYARVDLANDGQPVTVFRWMFSDKWQRNQLFLSASMSEEIPLSDPLPEGYLRKLSGPNHENDLAITEDTAPDLWDLEDYPGDDNFDFNIIRVHGKTYLLAADAAKAEKAVDNKGGRFAAFVLEYHSRDNLSLVCRVRGGMKKVKRG
jgi:hypothetical protein